EVENYGDFLRMIEGLKVNFPKTMHRIESVDITSKYEAVTIRGAGNVIKNSRLRATGVSVALDLSGPNQLIDGNTIVISSGSKDSAPIVLKMADNSVIRNNTIIIEGFGDKPEAAIHLIDSKNVVIENNKIVGVDKIYMSSKALQNQSSSVIEGKGERSNEFVSGWRRLFVH
ncbi:MAG TPA: right-handed parallel beta-helix repeat-containing protein, partial [Aquabacterium sp.]|nr:right-handed parallel beta-helix repeat-containing protein [Aquabacterium sp.]